MILKGNKGEWSEIYIYLKLLSDQKIEIADKNLQPIKNASFRIIKMFREETTGSLYSYLPGDPIRIELNGQLVKEIPLAKIIEVKNYLWQLISTNKSGSISSQFVENFLHTMLMHSLKSPACIKNNFFGGVADIVMQVEDYRTSTQSTLSFSCKTDFKHKSTLFNASKDNTNFRFELLNMQDELMFLVNNLYKTKYNADGSVKQTILVKERITTLKRNNIQLIFDRPLKDNASRNIILSGGLEMPKIVASLLKFYYWEHCGESSYAHLKKALNYLVQTNPAQYNFLDKANMYQVKVKNLLYDMFSGLKLTNIWTGHSDITGGYIVLKNNGEILSFPSLLNHEFKDFLFDNLALETPSSSRHNALQVYKIKDKYFINFNLQIRFINNNI